MLFRVIVHYFIRKQIGWYFSADLRRKPAMSDDWMFTWGLTAIAFGGASLIVPLYVVALGGNAFVLGVLFATASIIGVPSALVFGRLADRTGRRRSYVLLAITIITVMMAIIPLVNRITLVIIANALLWFAFAAAVPVLTLLSVVGTPEAHWSTRIARLNKFQGIGWALGLLLGFVVIAIGTRFVDEMSAQRAFFLICSGCTLLSLVLAVRTLPADEQSDVIPSPRRVRRRLLTTNRFNIRGAAFPITPFRVDVRQFSFHSFVARFTPRLAFYYLAVFLFFAGFGMFFAPLPEYLTRVGFDPSTIFMLYFILNAGAAVFFGVAATLSVKFDLIHVHTGGLLVRGLAIPLIALIGVALAGTTVGYGLAIGVFFIIGLTWAVIVVTAATLVTKLAPAFIRGEALGVYSALSALAGGVGGLLGGWLATVTYSMTFGAAGVLVIIGAGVVFTLQSGRDSNPATIS